MLVASNLDPLECFRKQITVFVKDVNVLSTGEKQQLLNHC